MIVRIVKIVFVLAIGILVVSCKTSDVGSQTIAAYDSLTAPAAAAPLPAMPQGQELVASVQRSLKDLGYDPGPIDGLLGPKTNHAIETYQEDVGLPPSGEIDEALYRSLAGATALEVDTDTESSEIAETSVVESASSRDLEADTSGASRDSPLQAVGPVSAPGCEYIEVLGYAEEKVVVDSLYYMGLRNNGDVAQIVYIWILPGRSLLGSLPGKEIGIRVNAKQIQNVELGFGPNPPKEVEIKRCT